MFQSVGKKLLAAPILAIDISKYLEFYLLLRVYLHSCK